MYHNRICYTEEDLFPMSDHTKKIAALSYVPLLSIVCLFGREEHFIRFHARQALVIHILIILWLLLPWWWLTVILELGSFVLLMYGFYYAAIGKEFNLPVVKQLLSK